MIAHEILILQQTFFSSSLEDLVFVKIFFFGIFYDKYFLKAYLDILPDRLFKNDSY